MIDDILESLALFSCPEVFGEKNGHDLMEATVADIFTLYPEHLGHLSGIEDAVHN